MAGVRDDVVPTLERSALFAGYSRRDIERLCSAFDEQTHLAGHGIVAEGMHGVDFFIILDGTATVENHGEVVARLQPGDFFGEVAALDDGPRTASVRAETQVRSLGLPNGTFRQFLLDNPRFAVNVMLQVVRRFRGVVTSANQRQPDA